MSVSKAEKDFFRLVCGIASSKKDFFKDAMSVSEAEKDFFRLVCDLVSSKKSFLKKDVMVNVINEVIDKSTRTVTPDFSRLRKSVAGFLIDETEDAVDGLHDAMDNMDFDEMNKLAHSLKSSWVPYRIGVLVDPVMEIAKQRNMGAVNRLATYMAEIDKMAEIVIAKCKEIQSSGE